MSVREIVPCRPQFIKCPSCWSQVQFEWDDLSYNKKRGLCAIQCPSCEEEMGIPSDDVPPYYTARAKARAK